MTKILYHGPTRNGARPHIPSVHTRKIGNTQKDQKTPKIPKDRRGARTDGDATAKRTGAQPSEHTLHTCAHRSELPLRLPLPMRSSIGVPPRPHWVQESELLLQLPLQLYQIAEVGIRARNLLLHLLKIGTSEPTVQRVRHPPRSRNLQPWQLAGRCAPEGSSPGLGEGRQLS